jgi:catechol 2,3-dioxygenase
MAFEMPAQASVAGLTLRVRDRERALAFYRDLLGLSAAVSDGEVKLSPAAGGFTLRLNVNSQAPSRTGRAVGLYHFAMLLPSRPALGAILRRLVEAEWPVDGASDHIVSEAIYLRDPDGNGIELARDRARKEWPYANGQLTMLSEMLDVDGLLKGAPPAAGLHPATRLGHMHLSVNDLSAGEAFYAGGLGLSVTQRTYPGALFLAAGDYHHHLGMNIWGAPRPAPAGATGLVDYTWQLPARSLNVLGRHLMEQGMAFRQEDASLVLTDPFGVAIVVVGSEQTAPAPS